MEKLKEILVEVSSKKFLAVVVSMFFVLSVAGPIFAVGNTMGDNEYPQNVFTENNPNYMSVNGENNAVGQSDDGKYPVFKNENGQIFAVAFDNPDCSGKIATIDGEPQIIDTTNYNGEIINVISSNNVGLTPKTDSATTQEEQQGTGDQQSNNQQNNQQVNNQAFQQDVNKQIADTNANEAQIKKTNEQLAKEKKELNAVKKELKAINKELASINKQLKETNSRIAELEKKKKNGTLTDKEKKELKELKNKKKNLQKKKKELKDKKEKLKKNKKELKNKIKDLKAKLKELDQKPRVWRDNNGNIHTLTKTTDKTGATTKKTETITDANGNLIETRTYTAELTRNKNGDITHKTTNYTVTNANSEVVSNVVQELDLEVTKRDANGKAIEYKVTGTRTETNKDGVVNTFDVSGTRTKAKTDSGTEITWNLTFTNKETGATKTKQTVGVYNNGICTSFTKRINGNLVKVEQNGFLKYNQEYNHNTNTWGESVFYRDGNVVGVINPDQLEGLSANKRDELIQQQANNLNVGINF